MPSAMRLIEDAVRRAALPFQNPSDLDALIADIGDARLVLLGEASHGTHEFYEARNQITQRLIEEKQFTAVVVEADWPDAWRVNRFVRGFHDDTNADHALSGFKRFPQWMWRNTDVIRFVDWLRQHNQSIAREQFQVGFYGMDLYSLHTSIDAVLKYLSRIDPPAAARARHRYACFDHFGGDPQIYGYAASLQVDQGCRDEVIEQLIDLRKSALDYKRRDGRVAADEYFYAEQNARLVANAEHYYRAMFDRRTNTWNLRDTHMVETIESLMRYLDDRIGKSKLVVWAHNSHLGDARATDSAEYGQINVGQLVRERWPQSCFLVGFTTHHGTVTAASDWDAPAETKQVQPSLPESYERLFHNAGLSRALMLLRHDSPAKTVLDTPRLERAIGVIYRPETERASHYFAAKITDQFDAIIHIDQTSAVRPLERSPEEFACKSEEETFPTGL